jgi:hypothetical protein
MLRNEGHVIPFRLDEAGLQFMTDDPAGICATRAWRHANRAPA